MEELEPPTVSSSAAILIKGIGRRWFVWAPALLLVFDVYGRLIEPLLPSSWQGRITVGPAWGVAALAILLLAAIIWTYHESRTELHRARTELHNAKHGAQARYACVKEVLHRCMTRIASLRDPPRASPEDAFESKERISEFLLAALPAARSSRFRSHCEKLQQITKGSNNVDTFSNFLEQELSQISNKLRDPTDILATFDVGRWRGWRPC